MTVLDSWSGRSVLVIALGALLLAACNSDRASHQPPANHRGHDGQALRISMPLHPAQHMRPAQRPAVEPGSWITVEPGTFTMGSPANELGREEGETSREITISRRFQIQATEVTRRDFSTSMGFDPSSFADCGELCPVEQVTWHEAAAYTNAMSDRDDLPTCYRCGGEGGERRCEPRSDLRHPAACVGYRLPTEAEWEYAARAGESRGTFGGALVSSALACERPNSALDRDGWFCGNSGGRTHTVALLRPNAWGIYDTLGNVWEWCHEAMGPPTFSSTDPVGPTAGSTRVNRGGGWEYEAHYIRLGQRSSDEPLLRCHGLGFRVARTINPATAHSGITPLRPLMPSRAAGDPAP